MSLVAPRSSLTSATMQVTQLDTHVYRVPTDAPEADGTIQWDSTTMLLVEAVADSGARGLGFSYASAAAATLVHEIPQDVAAGEYGYDSWYFRHMLQAGAVDILQADATRCLGVSGWFEAAGLAHSFAVPFSAHCGPSIHAQLACAAPQISHIEYFHDHVRIEHLFFDGVLEPVDGCLRPDPSRPGLGLELKRQDVERLALR